MAHSDRKVKKAMILAGGTGGHVMPALAVAQCLQAQSIAVHWVGTRQGIEATLVPKTGIPLSYIDIQGVRGKKGIHKYLVPWRITKALWQSYRILRKERPDLVLSMGGYVAGPAALVAWCLRRPLVLHEQNAIPGWTNRLLSRFASRIMVAFPEAFKDHKNHQKVVYTGNPIREAILSLPLPESRFKGREAPLRLLIMGGSQGALRLNEVVPQALALIDPAIRPLIWHQAGKHKIDYAQYGIAAKTVEFIEDMSEAYGWADLVICRSGALTIAELAAVGVASILVPFPHAVDDHQTANARYLSDREAAYLLPQADLSPEALRDLLLTFIHHPEKRLAMACASKALAAPLATATVAQHCIEASCE